MFRKQHAEITLSGSNISSGSSNNTHSTANTPFYRAISAGRTNIELILRSEVDGRSSDLRAKGD